MNSVCGLPRDHTGRCVHYEDRHRCTRAWLALPFETRFLGRICGSSLTRPSVVSP